MWMGIQSVNLKRFVPEQGPAAWTGKAMSSNPSLWLKSLTADQIKELEAAALHFANSGKDVGELSASDFPLPTMQAQLQQLQHSLLHEHGFQVFRGLPVSEYSQQEIATIFCGVGAHLGKARSQNAHGHILGHVKDIGADAKDHNTRIYQTAQRQSFHTDSADVVGLLCINDAKEGGESLLVSAVTLYNTLLERHPDLLPYLFEPIATDRRGEVPPGEKPYMTIPVFNHHEGFLTVFYQRQYIESAQRFEEAPRLTDKHIAALDRFDELANDPELHLSMRLEPGDMQFVYNHSQLHDRMGFLDHAAKDKRRHMLRLWLSMENDRPLPECFTQRYGSIEPGNRGGIIVSGTKLNVPLDV